LTNLRLQSWSS